MQKWELFIILKQPVHITVAVFYNLTILTNYHFIFTIKLTWCKHHYASNSYIHININPKIYLEFSAICKPFLCPTMVLFFVAHSCSVFS